MDARDQEAAMYLAQHTGVAATALHNARELGGEYSDGYSTNQSEIEQRRSRRKRKASAALPVRTFAQPLMGMPIREDSDGEYDSSSDGAEGADKIARVQDPLRSHSPSRSWSYVNRREYDNDSEPDEGQERAGEYTEHRRDGPRRPSFDHAASVRRDQTDAFKRRKTTAGTPFPSIQSQRPAAYAERPELNYMIPRSDGYNIVAGRDYRGDELFEASWIEHRPRDPQSLAVYNDVARDAANAYNKLRILGQKYMDHIHIRRQLLMETPLHYLIMVRFGGSLGIENKELLMEQDYINDAVKGIQDSIKDKIEAFEKAAKHAEGREAQLTQNLSTLRMELVVWNQIKTAPLLQAPSFVTRFRPIETETFSKIAADTDPLADDGSDLDADALKKWQQYAVASILRPASRSYEPANVSEWTEKLPAEFDLPISFMSRYLKEQIDFVDKFATPPLAGSLQRRAVARNGDDANADDEEEEVINLGDDSETAESEDIRSRRRQQVAILFHLWHNRVRILSPEFNGAATASMDTALDVRVSRYRRLSEFTAGIPTDKTLQDSIDRYSTAFASDGDPWVAALQTFLGEYGQTSNLVERLVEWKQYIVDLIKVDYVENYPTISLVGPLEGRNDFRTILQQNARQLSNSIEQGAEDIDGLFRAYCDIAKRQAALLTRSAAQFYAIARSRDDSITMQHERNADTLKAADEQLDLGLFDALVRLEKDTMVDNTTSLLNTPFVPQETREVFEQARGHGEEYEPFWNRLWKLAQVAFSTRRVALAANLQFVDPSDAFVADVSAKDKSTAKRASATQPQYAGSRADSANAVDTAVKDGVATVPMEAMPNLNELYTSLLKLEKTPPARLNPYFGHYTILGDYVDMAAEVRHAYTNLFAYMATTGLRLGPLDTRPTKTRLLEKWVYDLAFLCEDDTTRALIVSRGSDLVNMASSTNDVSIFDLAGTAVLFWVAVTRSDADTIGFLQMNEHYTDFIRRFKPVTALADVTGMREELKRRSVALESKFDLLRLGDFRVNCPLRFIAESAEFDIVETCITWFKSVIVAAQSLKLHIYADVRLAAVFTLIAYELVGKILHCIGNAVCLAKTDLNARLELQVTLAKEKLISSADSRERELLEQDLREAIVRGKDLMDPTKTGMVAYNNVVMAAFDKAEAWIRENAPVLMRDKRMAQWSWKTLIESSEAAHSAFAGLFADVAAYNVTDTRFRKNAIVQTSINTAYHMRDLELLRQALARYVLHPSGVPSYPIDYNTL